MADKKITELNELSSASLNDIFAVVDIAGSETKKITNESYITNVRNHESPLTASGVVISGDLIPKFPSGSTLGTADKPFAELYLQSGSIYVESDTPGDPPAVISNVSGNLEISVGGMLLIEPGNSFIADTGSFKYLSGSLEHIGSLIRSGSTDISGSLTASLTNEHVWIGDENNRSTEISASALATYLTSSFVTPEQTGSFVESAYISLYSSASQQLAVSGAAQPVTFNSVWAQDGVSLSGGSQLVMEKAGTYQFNFVAQVQNTENAVHDSYFWIKYNGNNFPNSATQMSLQPRKNESTPSAQLMTVNIVGVAQNDDDYIELYWTGDSNTIQLNETPGNGVKPETPSVIANIIRVG